MVNFYMAKKDKINKVDTKEKKIDELEDKLGGTVEAFFRIQNGWNTPHVGPK